MTNMSCNIHVNETTEFLIDKLSVPNDVRVVTIAGAMSSYPVMKIFSGLADLRRFRDTLDKYLSALPAEGVVESERKGDVQIAEDSQLVPL